MIKNNVRFLELRLCKLFNLMKKKVFFMLSHFENRHTTSRRTNNKIKQNNRKKNK